MDRDLRSFAAGVSSTLPATKRTSPAIRAGGTAAALADAADRPTADADALAAHVSEQLARGLRRDTLLILDDAHELEGAPGPVRFLESLCRQAPRRLHIILISRAAIPFPVDRLRGQGEVIDIGVADLAFSPAEVAAVLHASGVAPDDELVAEVHRATGGWPAAVRLGIEASHISGFAQIGRSGGPLFRYLAGEVFGREPTEVRHLLRSVAPIGRFTLDLLPVLGIDGGHATVDSLVRRGLFVEPAGDSYVLHDLAREFVMQAWPLSEPERRDIHARTARWHEGAGRYLEALESLADATDWAGLAVGIDRHGSSAVRAGGASRVLELVARLPDELRDAMAEQVAGEAHAVLGRPAAALASFERAAGKPGGDTASLAWRRAMTYYLHDDLKAVISLFERDQAKAAGADEALLLAWTASAYRRLGDLEQARALANRSLEAAIAAEDDRALAAAHTAVALVADDSAGSSGHVNAALAAAERAGDTHQAIRIRINRASDLLEQSAFVDAIDELGVALADAEVAGFTSLAALALMNRGLSRWCLGQLDEASRDYESAVGLYRAAGSRELSYAVIGRGDVHRERGDLELARAAYEEGLALAEATGDRQALVPALYQLAKILAADSPKRAAELADRAVGFGWPDQAWALNAKGWVAHARGDMATAREAGRESAAVARQREDWFGLAEALELQAMAASDPAGEVSRLHEAAGIWRRLGNELHATIVDLAVARVTGGSRIRPIAETAAARLRSMGIRPNPVGPAGLLTAIASREADPLAIRSLGGFGVARFGEPVSLSDWQSRKARDLLKMLVARRGRPVPRDELIAELWPEDATAAASRLSVTLSVLRGVLDPDKRFEADHFVASDRLAVRLEIEAIDIDVEYFFAAAARADDLRRSGRVLDATDALLAAEAAYTGDFLEENPYDDWAVGLRERARASYLDLTRTLAADASARNDHDATVRFLLRILERDPYDEESHLGLVSALTRSRRHGEARRAYTTYLRRMGDLGIEGTAFPDRPHG